MPKTALTPHCEKVLDLLSKSSKPMPAYDILGSLHNYGIKAPPTVYRALENLMKRGLVHRIESLNAFVACHGGHNEHHSHQHNNTSFAVCRECGEATEIHDHKLIEAIQALGKKLKFNIEREMLELFGLCHTCSTKDQKA